MTSVVARIVQRYKLALIFPRPSYLPPEVRDKEPLVPEGTDLAIWTWEKDGKLYGIAFQGKANKPLWHHRFSGESQRQRLIDETVNRRRQHLQGRADKAKERREFVHPYKVGDIFYTSWGYDQTNVDFYEVVGVKGKLLEVREIGKKVVRESTGADYVAAVPGSFEGPVMRVKPSQHGAKIDDHYASLWDGKPKYQTGFGHGH